MQKPSCVLARAPFSPYEKDSPLFRLMVWPAGKRSAQAVGYRTVSKNNKLYYRNPPTSHCVPLLGL